MKPKVLIFDSSSGVTGALKAGVYTADALKETFDVTFLIPKQSKASEFLLNRGYKVKFIAFYPLRKQLHVMFMYLPFLLYTSICLLSILTKGNFKFLVINDHNNMCGGVVSLFNWQGKIVSYVRRIPSSQGKLLSRIFLKVLEISSDRVVGVSNAVLKDISYRDDVSLIYDTVQFDDELIDRNFPSFLKIKFLYLANYMEGKGQLDALIAFKNTFNQEDNVSLRFMGADLGLEKNRKFKEQLKSIVKEYKLDKCVDILGYCEDVKNEILNSHILLNFAYSESFSMTCAEAALLGRPTIATKCGGPEEIIINNKTGLLVDIGHIASMSKVMKEISRDETKIIEMGTSAYCNFRKTFSFMRYKNQTLNLFKELT